MWGGCAINLDSWWHRRLVFVVSDMFSFVFASLTMIGKMLS